MILNRMFQLVMLLQATLPEFFGRSSAVASPEASLYGNLGYCPKRKREEEYRPE